MSDAEKLLAEALRAQAVSTGRAGLSGPPSGTGSARADAPSSAGVAAPAVPLHWVLLLALLLGLASGATIGLLTIV